MGATHYKSALVLGLGVSGRAAATLLLAEGTHVTVVDQRDGDELVAAAARLGAAGAQVELSVAEPPTDGFDVCVISPGISVESAWMRPVKACGIELISELELGAMRCHRPVLAVTGSNGKSTLVKLCGQAMRLAGCRASLAGNYGTPLCAVVAGQDDLDWIVVEVSSFHLEHTHNLAPAIAVLLNIQPDHLDRHIDMETYTGLKAGIFDNMSPSGTAVVLDSLLEEVRTRTTGQPNWVTFGSETGSDYGYTEGRIGYIDTSGCAQSLSLRNTPFCNDIMGLTAAAALGAIRSAGLGTDCVAQALHNFEPLPHRMQLLAEINGVRFINDSKATNLAALCGALRMVDRPVRLIAGGVLKEREFEQSKELLAKTVRSAYLIGESVNTLDEAWSDTVRCEKCAGLREATLKAWQEAESGDIVLLSPGCASFDQFKNFEDRGTRFQEIVQSLNGDGVQRREGEAI